jgi:hypothetical protein
VISAAARTLFLALVPSVLLAFFPGLGAGRLRVADSPAQSAAPLTPAKKEAIVRCVATEFRAKYVFADVAEKMAVAVESKFRRGGYDSFSVLDEFTSQLQKDLRSISRDRHIKVLPGEVPSFDADADTLRKEHFGFNTVEILPGNMGYLEFFQFYSVKDAGPTAIAAMNFLAGCDALIIDLRANGGGYPELRQLICSYFFDEPACLIEFRARDGVTQDWTLPYVPGPRMAKIPVYILLSRLSFSCAEDFAFCMRNLGRATLIGEATRGGAHDSKMWSFPAESISLQIPFSEAVDPKTKKTWEAVGVQPDIPVPAGQALAVAMKEAAKALLNVHPDQDRKFLLEWVLKDCETQLRPVELDPKALAEYAGRYGTYEITWECDRLYLHFDENRKRALLPVEADDFKIVEEGKRGSAAYWVRFTRDASGRVTELYLHDLDGDRYELHKREEKR